MSSEYTPTDEQIEALARMHHDYNWTPDMWGDAHPEHKQEYRAEWRSIVTSPAFQAIIRAAKAEAWYEGYDVGQAWESDMNDRIIPLADRNDNPYAKKEQTDEQ